MHGDDTAAGLAEYSHPLPPEPTAHCDGLSAVGTQAEAADIVGLGEATHGTREFFELKARLVRYLVTECGFRTVAFETDFANTLALDSYVQRGAGDPAGALETLLLWVWKTETIRELLVWLRRFNDGRPVEDRVRVHGLSLSDPANTASTLQRKRQQFDSAETESQRLDRFTDRESPDSASAREEYFEMGHAVAETIRDELDTSREEYVGDGSVREWQTLRRLCRHLEQNCAWNRLRLSTPERFDPEAFERRDQYMAENAEWCLETDRGEGVVVWAHNTHVKRGSFDMPHEWASGSTLGEFLDRALGARYRPYGTDFARGRFRAVPDDETAERGHRPFTVDEPVSGTVTAALDSLDRSRLFVDIDSASRDPQLQSVFEQQRRLRALSALVDPDAERRREYMETDLANAFDGLFFVEESTPTQPL